MAEVKVFDLAKELGLPSLELVRTIQSDLKMSHVKSHMSPLAPDDVLSVKKYFEEKARLKLESESKKKTRVVKKKAPPSTAEAPPAAPTRVAVTKQKAEVAQAPATPAPRAPTPRVTKAESSGATGGGAQRRIVLRRKGAPEEQGPERTRSETLPGIEEIGSQGFEGEMGSVEESAAPMSVGAEPTPGPSEKREKPGFKAATILHRPDRPVQYQARTSPAAAPSLTEEDLLAKDSTKRERPRVETAAVDEEGEGKPKKRAALLKKTEEFDPGEYFKKQNRTDVHSVKRKRSTLGRPARKTLITTPKESKRVIEMSGAITLNELAHQLHVKAHTLLEKANKLGASLETTDSVVDIDTATLIVHEYQFEVKDTSFKEDEALQRIRDVKTESTPTEPRSPVVTVMGHVDHGKTSLLDTIRKSNVAAGESGGITQHIGAYTVTHHGRRITFIDTPGHAAFTQMRSRGAKTTDIVILVVAANDGVMPQTVEAINHAKAAKAPIIVAINKIDLHDAQPEKVKQQLTEHEILSEEWGGETMMIPVSAVKGTGVENLLESILLTADVLELKAPVNVPGKGVVIESRLDKNAGPIATLLVQEGTLKVGNTIVAGKAIGRIRRMVGDHGDVLESAGPSTPVEVLGLNQVPDAGDALIAVANERAAEEYLQGRADIERQKSTVSREGLTLEDLYQKMQEGKIKELPVVLKADVKGSLEACQEAFQKVGNDQVRVKVIHAACGGITENDVQLAMVSNAMVFGFNVRPDTKALKMSEKEKVEVKTYKIIYEMIEQLTLSLKGLLGTRKKEVVEGRAEVRQIFSIPKVGVIAGSNVVDGKITRNSMVRLLRDSKIVYEGKLSSLKRFKDDVREVKSGYECGIGIENYNDVKQGDVIEAYLIEEIPIEMEQA